MRPFRSAICLLALSCSTPLAAQAAEPVDEAAVAILRKHGLEQSQVMELLSWITDVYGPRLTGSPNLRNAQKWAQAKLTEWKLANPRLEAWGPFGRGWKLEHCSMHVVGENPWPVLAWPKAWSPAIDGRVEAEVIAVGDMDAQTLEATDLRGKIVLLESPREVGEPFDATARRIDAEGLLALADGRSERQPELPGRRSAASARDLSGAFRRRGEVLSRVWEKQPLAILDRGSKGDYGTLFIAGATVPAPPGAGRGRGPSPYDPGVGHVIPQFTLAVEHYNRLCRILQKGLPVRIALELRASFFDADPMEYNVLADIPGSDPQLREEIVMLGAHFDSWHSGTGTTDNGCGSAVMLEATRLLTQLMRETGRAPRRTIRLALWSGEEQGLRGSRAYVAEHFAVAGGRGEPPVELKPDHARFAGYFNLDNGTGRIRGVYLQGNEAVAPIFRAWLRPFHDLDASTLTLGNTGGTDHLAFDAVGLPGFQFIQDPVAYSPRTHHSNMDLWDHAIEADLKQAATIIASFVWHTAQRDEKLPRKPPPPPAATDAESRR